MLTKSASLHTVKTHTHTYIYYKNKTAKPSKHMASQIYFSVTGRKPELLQRLSRLVVTDFVGRHLILTD